MEDSVIDSGDGCGGDAEEAGGYSANAAYAEVSGLLLAVSSAYEGLEAGRTLRGRWGRFGARCGSPKTPGGGREAWSFDGVGELETAISGLP